MASLTPYPVIAIPPERQHRVETLGSKVKFWVHLEDQGWALYKERRANTGEHWAEKVAAELAELLGLPHAAVDLATYKNTEGTLSPTFVPEDAVLIHGNELLLARDPAYPTAKTYRVRPHTLANVFAALEGIHPMPPIGARDEGIFQSWQGCMVGYLMLDAWIGNSDRHHENWAVVRRGTTVHLAPTYDHASSLGRELTDDRRAARLATRDRAQSLEAYASKCRSAFYQAGREQPLSPLDAFHASAAVVPAWRTCLDRLRLVDMGSCASIIARIPAETMSNKAREFALRLLDINQQRLLELEGDS